MISSEAMTALKTIEQELAGDLEAVRNVITRLTRAGEIPSAAPIAAVAPQRGRRRKLRGMSAEEKKAANREYQRRWYAKRKAEQSDDGAAAGVKGGGRAANDPEDMDDCKRVLRALRELGGRGTKEQISRTAGTGAATLSALEELLVKGKLKRAGDAWSLAS